MTHNLWGTPTYHSWVGMKARCSNPNHVSFPYYGGKGIKICKRWENFSNFLEDMGIKPDGMTLDRQEGDKDYCKENCRWATWSEQNHNKKLTKNNTSGIKGVSFDSGQQIWKARVHVEGTSQTLYRGDLLEACAHRKSWELQHVS